MLNCANVSGGSRRLAAAQSSARIAGRRADPAAIKPDTRDCRQPFLAA